MTSEMNKNKIKMLNELRISHACLISFGMLKLQQQLWDLFSFDLMNFFIWF